MTKRVKDETIEKIPISKIYVLKYITILRGSLHKEYAFN